MSSLSNYKLRLATAKIKAGNIIAYPTEAVYGLGCDPLNEIAVLKLLALKQRLVEKGLILIAADFSQLAPFLIYDETLLNKISAMKSETITWIIPAQKWVPKWLTGNHQSLAIRITNHPLAKALCQQAKSALISTSANPSKKKPALNDLQVRRYFNAQQVILIKGATGGNKTTSRIYDAKTGNRLR